MKYDALIESYQTVLERVSESCTYCEDGTPHRVPDGCVSPGMEVRDEIARLRGVQRELRGGR